MENLLAAVATFAPVTLDERTAISFHSRLTFPLRDFAGEKSSRRLPRLRGGIIITGAHVAAESQKVTAADVGGTRDESKFGNSSE